MAIYETDVAIVGGGPVGLVAAIACAQRGLRVFLADAARPPLDKACGEGLMSHALGVLRALNVSLADEQVAPFEGIRFLNNGRTAEARFRSGPALGVRRTVLHQALARRAVAAGVELAWGERVTGLSEDGSGLLLDRRRVRARWVIGADGLQSRVRAWAGLSRGRTRTRRIGQRRHFALRPWSRFVEVYWSAHGQAYVTPVGPNEVGVAVLSREKAASLDEFLESLPELRDRLAEAVPSTSLRGALSIERRLSRCTRGSVALVGDAAGSVDSITGEGLGIGFRQALALADAIASGSLHRYESASRAILRMPSFMSQTLLLMDRSALIRREAVRVLGRSPRLFSGMLRVHTGE